MRYLILVLGFALFITSDLLAAQDEDELKTEYFYTSSAGIISLTSATGGLFKPFPERISTFDNPTIAHGFLVNTYMYDVNGNLIGFATEQELLSHAGPDKLNFSDWSLKIPGRGAIFATEVERFNWLFEVINEMVATGELEKSFDPPLERWTTEPGTGKIIGGTGEFEKANGELREFNRFRSISLLTGVVDVDIVLEFNFHKALKDEEYPQ